MLYHVVRSKDYSTCSQHQLNWTNLMELVESSTLFDLNTKLERFNISSTIPCCATIMGVL